MAQLFKVLADPVRLRLLALVAAQPDNDVCACDLVDELDRSQPTISHHLKQLHESGVLTRERRGAWIHYGVADGVAEQLEQAIAVVLGSSNS